MSHLFIVLIGNYLDYCWPLLVNSNTISVTDVLTLNLSLLCFVSISSSFEGIKYFQQISVATDKSADQVVNRIGIYRISKFDFFATSSSLARMTSSPQHICLFLVSKIILRTPQAECNLQFKVFNLT